MKHAVTSLATVLSILLVASDAAAQYAYPARGQGPKTQAKDEAECSRWATGKTGYDPARPPSVAPATPAPVTGSGARLRGAAGGAAIGAISGGDVGEAAATGAVIGGVRRRVANRRAADAQNQASAQYVQAGQDSYLQARGACLSGRGYTLK